PPALRAALVADLRLLPEPARLARGSRGRPADDVPQRATRARARRRSGLRARLALQDCAERLPQPPSVCAAAWTRRGSAGSGRVAGRARDAGARQRRLACRSDASALGGAGATAACAPPAGVSGTVI